MAVYRDVLAVHALPPQPIVNLLVTNPKWVIVEDACDQAEQEEEQPGEPESNFHLDCKRALLERLAKLLAEDRVVDIEAAAIELIRTLEVSNAE
jgi:hypothetical protein